MEAKWKEVRVLGQGSFGFVRLFVNQSTNDKIALKEMRVGILETLEPSEREKMKTRLKTEIKIMWEHNHDNLVKAMYCPESMPYSPDENVIHVWMEYCDGGDLRKGGLSLPRNCCGLMEPEVRTILAHINSGLIFLHRHHIIHRDLKPENILLKNGPNGEIVYKLTDFGYAKSYESSSYADSMVGTPQYVAPEILNSHPHGSTVDFWSFGVVAFELSTGTRPFLHLARNPYDWVGPTGSKPDDCIHIYWPESGSQYVTSNRIPNPNNLSCLFTDMLTQWLQMSLQNSPNKRGGVASHSSREDAPCLMKMEQLLRTRILYIICMSTGDILEMKIDSKDSLSSVRQWLKSRGHSNPDELYIVTEKGQMIIPNDNVVDIYNAFFQPNVYTATVYLYTTVLQPSFKLVQKILPNVAKLLAMGDEKLLRDERPTVYGHVYFHFHEFWRLFDRLNRGHKSMVCIITGIEDELRSLTDNNSLLVNFCQCLGASDQVIQSVSKNHQMLLSNSDSLTKFEMQCSIKESLESWSSSIERLTNKIKEMQSSLSEVQRVQREAEEVLTTTEVMNQRHLCSEEHFKEFDKKYVKEALRYFRLVKADGSYGDVANLLQLATNEAENIIQDDLNGVDYLSVYLRLSNLLTKAKSFNGIINDVKRDCNDIVSSVCNNMWSMILTSTSRRTLSDSCFTTQLSDSHFATSVNRNNSVGSVSSTVSSSHHIIQRLYSSQSTSTSEESDGPTDVDSLMGSLKEHICQMSKNSETVVARNKTILSKLDSHSGVFNENHSITENSVTPVNSHN